MRFKSSEDQMRQNHIVLFIIFGNKRFTRAVDKRKAEVAISRKEDNRTINYSMIVLGHFSSTSSNTGNLIPQHETIPISNVYNKIVDAICFNDQPRTKIDSGDKCSVTNNIDLLWDVKWFDDKRKSLVHMKDDTSDQPIVPEAEVKLRVKAITSTGYVDVQFYFLPQFNSNLLSHCDVLCSSPFAKDFSGQILSKYFELNNELIHNDPKRNGTVNLNHVPTPGPS